MSDNPKRNRHRGGAKRDAPVVEADSKPSGDDKGTKARRVVLLRPCKGLVPSTWHDWLRSQRLKMKTKYGKEVDWMSKLDENGKFKKPAPYAAVRPVVPPPQPAVINSSTGPRASARQAGSAAGAAGDAAQGSQNREFDADPFSDVNDPHGIALSIYKDEIKEARQKNDLRSDIFKKVFADLQEEVSNESMSAVALQAEEWKRVEEDECPIGLMNLYMETHQPFAEPGATDIDDQLDKLKMAGCNFKQKPGETLGAYYLRFENYLKGYDAIGQDRPGEPANVRDFIRGMDTSFAGYKAETNKDKAKRNGAYPLSVMQIVATAEAINASVSAGIIHRPGPQAVFATTTSPTSNPKQASKKDSGSEKPAQAADKEEKKRKKFQGKIECWGCGETGHIAAKCPKVKETVEEVKEKKKKIHFTSSEDEPLYTFPTVCPGVEFAARVPDGVYTLQKSGELDRYAILLDNQAQDGLCNDSEILSDLRDLDQPKYFTGVNDSANAVNSPALLKPASSTMV